MPCLQVWTDVLHGPDAPPYGDGLAWDRYWTRRGLRSIRSEPDVYLRYAAEKLGTFWVGDPHADWANTRVFNEEVLLGNYVSRPRDVTLLMLSRVTPIVAAAAVLMLLRRWRLLLPVLALLGYATLLHAATHAEARLSEPFHPLLFVLIAGAAAALGGDLVRAAKGVLRKARHGTPGSTAGAGRSAPGDSGVDADGGRAAPERDPDAPWESWVAYEPGLVPPLRMMREEGIEVLEDWFRWAEEWNVFLRAYGGVGGSSRVLEIGCGLGRIAYPLRIVIGPDGGYDGFEICRWKVDHLDRTFTPAHPNFRFTWADVRNTFYNPSGSTPPDAYRFPYPDRTFDVVYAASVFTHMAPEGASRYVREAARVLKPDGRCVFSFFLLDHYRPGRARPLGFDHPRFEFAHSVEPWADEFATVVPSNPEQMTAYRLSLVERFAADGGLELARPVLPGIWSGSAGTWVAAQDLVVLRPRGAAARHDLGEPS
jgi:SAM-dependent methyltransferase